MKTIFLILFIICTQGFAQPKPTDQGNVSVQDFKLIQNGSEIRDIDGNGTLDILLSLDEPIETFAQFSISRTGFPNTLNNTFYVNIHQTEVETGIKSILVRLGTLSVGQVPSNFLISLGDDFTAKGKLTVELSLVANTNQYNVIDTNPNDNISNSMIVDWSMGAEYALDSIELEQFERPSEDNDSDGAIELYRGEVTAANLIIKGRFLTTATLKGITLCRRIYEGDTPDGPSTQLGPFYPEISGEDSKDFTLRVDSFLYDYALNFPDSDGPYNVQIKICSRLPDLNPLSDIVYTRFELIDVISPEFKVAQQTVRTSSQRNLEDGDEIDLLIDSPLIIYPSIRALGIEDYLDSDSASVKLTTTITYSNPQLEKDVIEREILLKDFFENYESYGFATYYFLYPKSKSFKIETKVDSNNMYPEISEVDNSKSIVIGDGSFDESSIDLAIKEVKIGQVFKLDTDSVVELVQNKEADILVTPELLADNSSLPGETVIEIKATQGSQVIGTKQITLGFLRGLNENSDPVIIDGVDTSVAGNASLNVEIGFVDSTIQDTNIDNNSRDIVLDIRQSTPINANFYTFGGCSGEEGRSCPTSPINNLVSLINGESKDLALRTIPLSNDSLRILDKGIFKGSPINAKRNTSMGRAISSGLIEDMKNLGLKKSLRKFPENEDLNRPFLIVSRDYFRFHGYPGEYPEDYPATLPQDGVTYGVTNTGVDIFVNPASIIADDSDLTVFPHELVHTLVLLNGGGDGKHTDEPIIGAYDAERNINITEGITTYNYLNQTSFSPIATEHWIDKKSYQDIFAFLQNPIKDPKVMIVSGILARDGSVEITETFISNEGVLTPNSSNGAIELVSKSSDGTILNNFSFDIDFELLSIPLGVIEVDREPFVVSLPYNEEVSNIEIVVDGEVRSTIDPFSKGLVDAFRSIDAETQIVARRDKLRIKEVRKKILLKIAKGYEFFTEKYNKEVEACNNKQSRRNRYRFYKNRNNCKSRLKLLEKAVNYKLRLLKKKTQRWLNEKNGELVDRTFILNLINTLEERNS